MPWSGSGLFTRLYNFVDDAANGIKILASKQDAEWNNVVAGVNNVICRDGQNTPATDINWGGHKITNLSPGTAGSDAATYSQVLAATSAQNEWVTETRGTAYLSPTQIKVLSVDAAYTYHIGRRIMGLVTGVGYCLGTIINSAYSAPDTIVTVAWDASPISSSLTTVWYGLLSYITPAYLSPRTAVFARGQAGITIPNNTYFQYPFNAPDTDVLGEFTSSYFSAKYPGSYRVSGTILHVPLAGTPPISEFLVYLYKQGSALYILYDENKAFPVGSVYTAPFSGIVRLNAGEYVSIVVHTTAGNEQTGGTACISVDRIV